MTGDVFGKQLTISCSTDGCTNTTGHSTGLCSACRTRKCIYCNKHFTISKTWSAKENRCAQCRRSKCRKS